VDIRPRCVKFGLNQTGILDPGLSQCKVPCLVGEARGINPISGSRETKQAVTAGNAKNMLQLEGLRAASRPDRNNRLVSVLEVCCRVDRNCRALWSVPSVLDQVVGYGPQSTRTYVSLPAIQNATICSAGQSSVVGQVYRYPLGIQFSGLTPIQVY
jgi:hypothetical protein